MREKLSGISRPFLVSEIGFSSIDISYLPRNAIADRVVVAPGDERRARGGAQGGRMELRVAQSRLGDTIQRRRWDHAAEGAGNPVALVIGHDEKDVGRPLGGTTRAGQ